MSVAHVIRQHKFPWSSAVSLWFRTEMHESEAGSQRKKKRWKQKAWTYIAWLEVWVKIHKITVCGVLTFTTLTAAEIS